MDRIGIRELQQHASAALRRVARGETIGVTDRGRLIAVLSPPDTAVGAAGLVASGRVTEPRRAVVDLPPLVERRLSTEEVLNDLRGEG